MIMKAFDDESGSETPVPYRTEFGDNGDRTNSSGSGLRPRMRLDEAFDSPEDESDVPSLAGYHMRLAAMNNDLLLRQEHHRR